MRWLPGSCSAALAAATLSLGWFAGAAVADGPASAGSLTTAASPATTPATAASTATTPTTPTHPAAQPAVKARAKLYLADGFTVSRNEVTVPRRAVEVQG